MTHSDHRWMRYALTLGERNLGQTWPNPSVGCVIIRDGQVVGVGNTAPGGRPHAETQALKQAGDAARGAAAYITLEPCAHHGHTPPCAQALIDAGIFRAVIAVQDPDPRVAGQGVAMLRAAGIEVVTGVCEAEAHEHHRGFFSRIQRQRPMVALKIASSLDGYISLANGASQWITGPEARAYGHLLRAKYDAIMVGSGTALADNPALDCRLPGLEAASPVRVVADSQLRLPLDSKLVAGARDIPLWILCTPAALTTPKAEALHGHGVTLLAVETVATPQKNMARAIIEKTHAMLACLAAQGVTRLLVEGGPMLATALAQAHTVDRLYWFRSGTLLGADAKPAIGVLQLSQLKEALGFQRKSLKLLGNDILEVLEQL